MIEDILDTYFECEYLGKNDEMIQRIDDLGSDIEEENLYIVPINFVSKYKSSISINTLKPYKNIKRYGYLEVYLRLPGSKKTYKIHRLVAEAFIPNPDNLPQINHIDENKENNIVSNLEWCTAEYNLNYGSHNKKISQALKRKVFQYSKDGILLAEFNSQTEAAKLTGSKQGGISDCIRGKIKTHNGYIWKY